MKKLLLSFAHPDDETFTCGGTVAKYVQAGWEVHLLSATRGEAGGGGPYGEVSKEALGNIRQKELENAGIILGIRTITWLGYADGSLSELNPGELEDVLYRQMTSFVPDVVITFEPGGITNHPDHKKICLSTTFAFQKYAAFLLPKKHIGQRDKKSFEATIVQEQSEPRLYYACMPQSMATYFKKQKRLPVESFGKPWEGTPDNRITTVITIQKFSAKKTKALRAHKSQQSDVDRFLASPPALLHQEYFLLRMQGVYEVFMGKTDRVANRL